MAESSDRVVIGNTLEVRTVPAPEFMRLASNADRAVRDIDEGHLDRRGVLCEPAGRRLFGFGGDRPVPLRLAQAGTLPEGSVLFFPDMATDLMAIRAKGTIDLLLSLVEEFAELEVQPLVKLGYPTDNGRSHEHLWFEFHGLTDSTIDATLQNEPYEVSSLRPRERALHPRDLLTDWILLSPVGSITPRSLAPARRMREDRDRLRDELAAWRREQEGGG